MLCEICASYLKYCGTIETEEHDIKMSFDIFLNDISVDIDEIKHLKGITQPILESKE